MQIVLADSKFINVYKSASSRLLKKEFHLGKSVADNGWVWLEQVT